MTTQMTQIAPRKGEPEGIGAAEQDQQPERPAAGRGWTSSRANVHDQLEAMGARRVLIRLSDPLDPARRLNRRMELSSVTVTQVRDWNDDGYDVSVAPDAADGLIVIGRVSKSSLTRLMTAGLEPACVVRGGARYDAFIRVAAPGDPIGGAPRILTAAARLAAAIAGENPRAAHWQRGGMVVGTRLHLTGGPAAKLHDDAGIVAPCGRELLDRAADLVERIESARDDAYQDGVDPIGEMDGLAAFSGPNAEEQARKVYEHQAALARCYGLTNQDAIDAMVAVAALKAGADPDRVRAIIRAGSPDLGRRHRNQKAYLANLLRTALADPGLRRHVAQTLQRYGKIASVIDANVEATRTAVLLQMKE